MRASGRRAGHRLEGAQRERRRSSRRRGGRRRAAPASLVPASHCARRAALRARRRELRGVDAAADHLERAGSRLRPARAAPPASARRCAASGCGSGAACRAPPARASRSRSAGCTGGNWCGNRRSVATPSAPRGAQRGPAQRPLRRHVHQVGPALRGSGAPACRRRARPMRRSGYIGMTQPAVRNSSLASRRDSPAWRGRISSTWWPRGAGGARCARR